MRGKDVDLRCDPPPDLVVEVDVHASCLDRLRIYAALGVPEIWRWKDGQVTVFLTSIDGTYRTSDRSLAFPWVPVAELAKWLDKRGQLGQTTQIRQFRAWVRASFGTG